MSLFRSLSTFLISPTYLLCALCVFGAQPLFAADWPQFRGPNGTAVADGAALPVKWSATENVRWKTELPGRGLSNPVIAAGRVYVTACSGYQENRLHVLCLDRATGKKLWERQLAATGNTTCNPKTCMAAPTPVTDSRRVFALFATGDLAAFDRDGNLLWYRALVRDYPDVTNQVGLASSPVLAGETLLLPLDNAGDSFIAGLDAASGKNRWLVKRDRDINWTTPLVRTEGGRAEALFLTGKELLAVDAATGRKRWAYRGEGLNSSASPIAADGFVILPGGVALQPPAIEGSEPAVVWTANKLRAGYSSHLFYRGRIYVLNSAGILHCADAADGNILWSQRVKGPFWASPVAGDGKVYVVNEAGTIAVVEAGGKEGRVLATNNMGESILATPAIADGAIFLRSDRHLYCVGDR